MVLHALLALILTAGVIGWVVHSNPAGSVQPKWFGIAATPDGQGYWVVSSRRRGAVLW